MWTRNSLIFWILTLNDLNKKEFMQKIPFFLEKKKKIENHLQSWVLTRVSSLSLYENSKESKIHIKKGKIGDLMWRYRISFWSTHTISLFFFSYFSYICSWNVRALTAPKNAKSLSRFSFPIHSFYFFFHHFLIHNIYFMSASYKINKTLTIFFRFFLPLLCLFIFYWC